MCHKCIKSEYPMRVRALLQAISSSDGWNQGYGNLGTHSVGPTTLIAWDRKWTKSIKMQFINLNPS